MLWRRKILLKAKKDEIFREKVRQLFFRDPIFAFNAFFYTYDPRKRPFHQQPFCTYSYQDEYIWTLVNAINNGEDLFTGKSRDMGASWCVMLVFLWFWLNPAGGADFLCGSRIEDYVDKKGDMRTLIEKVRYTLYRLPFWLRPSGFRKNQHDNFMRITNPETGASITGESNNPNFSTGGRYAAILFDEFAKWESSDESAWTAAGDASPCRLPVSTPFGAGGQYYKLSLSDSIAKQILFWTQHPDKAYGLYCEWPAPNWEDKEKEGDKWEPIVKLRSPWYDKEGKRRSPREMAQEVDMNFLGSGNPVFEGEAAMALMWYVRQKPIPPIAWLNEHGDELPSPPRDEEGYLVVWERPKPKQSYILAVDVAEGKIEGDYSVIKILCRETKDVVASYYSHIDEVSLASVINVFASYYPHNWVAIEAIGPGLSTFDQCLELGVTSLFMMPRYETAKQTVTYRKGWITSGASRNAIIAGIKEYLIERNGFLNSRLIGELTTFVRNKSGRPEAKSGCHDDEVMAFGIAIQVDQIVPWEALSPNAPKIMLGLEPKDRLSLEDCKISEEGPRTHEERCLTQALSRQADLVVIRQMQREDSLDLFDF